MTFRPRPPGPKPRTDISRIARAPDEGLGTNRHQAVPIPLFHCEHADSIQRSPEARALVGHEEREPVVSGALSNDRMQRVSRRCAAAHYDRPDVVEAVLVRLLSDL